MLHLVDGAKSSIATSPIVADVEAEGHHRFLLEAFYQSFRIRGFSSRTVTQKRQILEGWFVSAGDADRPLYVWEAMDPETGRQRIRDYAGCLVKTGLAAATIRGYLLVLNQFFAFVLDYPYIRSGNKPLRIDELYGAIAQPISKFDLPVHGADAEIGVPIDPERVYEFLSFLLKHYLGAGRKAYHLIRGRNYAMAVLAMESGLRSDELAHLCVDDLFFDSKRVQTRFAKGKRGSGKRSRTTLFPPLSRATLKYYLKNYRPSLLGSKKSKFLFLSKQGGLISSPTMCRIAKDLRECAKNKGFPVSDHLTWHWYRRLFATRFIEDFPEKLPALLELLGHSNLATVHCYIKHSEAWMDKEIQNVLERVDKWPSSGD